MGWRGTARRHDQRLTTNCFPQIMETVAIVRRQEAATRSRGALPKLRPMPYPSRVAAPLEPRPRRPLPSLPNEIIALIISSIPDAMSGHWDYDRPFSERKKALARLCLVSRAFLAPARAMLYWGLGISSRFMLSDSIGCHTRGQAHVAALVGTPHLASLIREVILDFPADPRNIASIQTLFASSPRLLDLDLDLSGRSGTFFPSLVPILVTNRPGLHPLPSTRTDPSTTKPCATSYASNRR